MLCLEHKFAWLKSPGSEIVWDIDFAALLLFCFHPAEVQLLFHIHLRKCCCCHLSNLMLVSDKQEEDAWPKFA